MKIQIVKKAKAKTSSTEPCPYLVEVPPEAAKKSPACYTGRRRLSPPGVTVHKRCPPSAPERQLHRCSHCGGVYRMQWRRSARGTRRTADGQDRHVLSEDGDAEPGVGTGRSVHVGAAGGRGWDGRPVYRLAESVTESSDGRLLTVKLRRDVRFHTGELMTAPWCGIADAGSCRSVPEIASIEAIDDDAAHPPPSRQR